MKKVWKIIIAISIVILLILIGVSWYISRHWKPILSERLQALVSASSDGLYRLSYEDFDFSWYSGNAYLTNVSLTPVKEVYERLKATGDAPDNQYSIQIRSIKVKNFHPTRLYKQRRLNINEILVQDPTVLVINEDLPQNDSLQPREKKTPYQRLSNLLHELRVDKFNVNNLNFTYRNNTLDESKETKLKNINVAVQDFLIDSLSQKDSSRVYYSSGIDFKMDSYQVATRDSMYYINFSAIDFSTSDKRLKVDRIELKPRQSKADFYKVSDKPAERFDLAFDSLLVENINIPELLNNQRFHAQRITIGKGSVEVYNNTNYARAPTSKKGKDPHQQLQKLAWNLNIDTLDLLNTDISYEELSKVTQQTGKLSFNNSTIRFTNVTNDSLAKSRNHLMDVSMQARFMNAASLQANLRFDLISDKGDFEFEGKLNAMNGRVLNPVLVPLAEVEISSANIQSLVFNFKANENDARGTVNFRYNDLKVKLLMLEEKGIISKNQLASTVANSFIISSSNPTETGEFTSGAVYYRRPQTYSLFKFMWKSIFQGVKTSVGVSQEREARLKRTAERTKQRVEDTKQAAQKVGSFIKGIFNKKEDDTKKEGN